MKPRLPRKKKKIIKKRQNSYHFIDADGTQKSGTITWKDMNDYKKGVKVRFDGGPLNICEMNLAMYGEMDPDYPKISAEDKKRIYDICRPTFKLPKGRVMIFGTGGPML